MVATDSHDEVTSNVSRSYAHEDRATELSREEVEEAMNKDDESVLNDIIYEPENMHERRESTDHMSMDDISLDEEEEESFDAFVHKYGDIKVKYIKKPKYNNWYVTKPYALNFFYKGVLFRTKGERGESSKTELFLDLMYVGLVAKLAASATENASGASLLQYVLLFLPVWQVWNDIKDFMNYYFNDDLSQKVYILWILALLTIYANSSDFILDGRSELVSVIVPYMLCRISLMISFAVYSFFIPQHRGQMRLYSGLIFVTCCLWIIVIFVGLRAKIAVSFIILFLERLSLWVAFNPITKKLMKLKYSTALNIEHEVERYGAFYVIAIGEFLYKIVANSSSLGPGLSVRVGRAIMLLIMAYCLMWLYFNSDGSKRAVHAIRRSAFTAIAWLEAHTFLIAALILSADAAGDLCSFEDEYTGKPHTADEQLRMFLFRREGEGEGEEEEVNRYALTLMFTGGVCVSLISLTALAFLDKSMDPKTLHRISKELRVLPRVPIAIIILCLAFAEMEITKLMATIMCLLLILTVYELYFAQDICADTLEEMNRHRDVREVEEAT